MAGRRRSAHAAVVALALLIAACVAAAPAGAKTVIVKSHKKDIPDGGQATQKLPCPQGMHVLSGGGYSTGGSLGDQLAESAPYDGHDHGSRPDDGWLASFNSLTLSGRRMLTFATCSDSIRATYRHHASNLTAFGTESVVECPDGTHAVGGGLTVAGDATDAPMGASVTFTGGTWVSWTEFGNGDGVVHAVCAKGHGFTYPTQTESVANGFQSFVVATCPPGSKLIGGGAVAVDVGEETAVSLASLDPTDPDGRFQPPWRRWEGWLNNESGSAQNLRTVAVCHG
jgi:hypothetical protein